jgi:alpha-1,2-mannosyltransferase
MTMRLLAGKGDGALWPRRRGGLLALTSKSLLVFLALGYLVFVHSRIDTRRNDFSAVYLWTAAAQAKLDPYVDDLQWLEEKLGIDANGNSQANYPPTFIVLFRPLASLSPEVAYWTWFCLSLVMLTAAMILLLEKEVFWFALLMVLYEPLTDHFLWAQTYTLLLLLLVLLKRAIGKAWWNSAGLTLGLLGALKIFPFLMVGYLLRTRRYRSALLAVGWVVVFAALTVVLFGFGRSLSFLSSTSFNNWEPWLLAHSNVSVGAMVTQWIRGYDRALVGPSSWFFAGLAGCAVLVLTVLRTPSSDPDGKAFGLWVITSAALFPICWPSHMVLFVVPFAEIFASRDYAPPLAVAFGVASYVVSVALVPLHWLLLLQQFEKGWLYTMERAGLIVLLLTVYSCAFCLSRQNTTLAPA